MTSKWFQINRYTLFFFNTFSERKHKKMPSEKKKRRYEIYYQFDANPYWQAKSIVYESSERKATKKLIKNMKDNDKEITISHVTWMYCE